VPAWSSQVALYIAAYLGYGATRWLVISDRGAAVAHARSIERLERALHVAVEGPVQRALAHTPLMWVLGDAYLAAQVVVVPAVLVWLYRARRVIYVRLRDTVLATWTPLIVLAVVATGNHFPLRRRGRRGGHHRRLRRRIDRQELT
jgi:hypothetical protein